MIGEQAIKERAMQIDPCAFKSYSGSSRREAQQEALARARRELEWEESAAALRTLTITCEKCGWSFTPPMKGGCDHKDCEYAAQPRRYSLNEIDRMRAAIRRVQPFGRNRPFQTGPSTEEQLRTAMIGGVGPQELENKADEHWARIHERREARQREREADAERARFAGRMVSPSVMAQAEAIIADAPIGPCWKQTILVRIETLLHRLGVGR